MSKKKVKKQNPIYKPILLALIAALLIAVGVFAGYLIPKSSTQPGFSLASKSQIKEAKDQINNSFKKLAATDCIDPEGTTSPKDREATFDKYLKVNKYANRAVIRGCNGVDALLYKNQSTGAWEQSTVNVNLDARANPIWQKECLADDITVADDVARQENTSIDSHNLLVCRILKEKDQVWTIYNATGTQLDNEEVDQLIDDTERYIREIDY